MGEPYLGEVRVISFNFPPKGWAFCNGQVLPIAQNQALFAILGTNYGGNGQTTFGLPNLQTRTPMHWGNGQGLPGVSLGQIGGEASHTLTIAEMAGHAHTPSGSTTKNTSVLSPAGSMLGVSSSVSSNYSQTAPNTTLATGTVGMSAGGQPHNNMQPYQVLNFIIALQGIFPSRN